MLQMAHNGKLHYAIGVRLNCLDTCIQKIKKHGGRKNKLNKKKARTHNFSYPSTAEVIFGEYLPATATSLSDSNKKQFK
jgi:hypothetical protein